MGTIRGLLGLGAVAAACASCAGASGTQSASVPKGQGAVTFDDDVDFLRRHGAEVTVMESPSGGRIAVSATHQGRVMTSAVEPGGRSLGWIHRNFIEQGKTGTQFDNYGGEDRFWLGPEGGQFGLYFAPGAGFDMAHWQTPEALQSGAWSVEARSPTSITFKRSMLVTNWSGTRFSLEVTRTIRVLDAEQAGAMVGAGGAGVKWIGFQSENTITNTGKETWTADQGLPSIWILSMLTPSPDTFVVVPYDKAGQGPIANDSYFGKVPADRLRIDEQRGVVVFRCDGKHRSKIGLGPSRARPVLGSYSPSARLLTIAQYDKPAGATRYVNSMWERQAEPYAGDVVNSYNDGPTEPGKPPLGGFYEIESSSPAAALGPGGQMAHRHTTWHFTGEPTAIDAISSRVLGVAVSALSIP